MPTLSIAKHRVIIFLVVLTAQISRLAFAGQQIVGVNYRKIRNHLDNAYRNQTGPLVNKLGTYPRFSDNNDYLQFRLLAALDEDKEFRRCDAKYRSLKQIVMLDVN